MMLKNVRIKSLYEIKHFIEKTSYCEVYSGIDLSNNKPIGLSIYNAEKIARDDIGPNGELREIEFLEMGIEGFPKLLSYGSFLHDAEKYRYIATEFISGESVMDRLRRTGPIDEFDAVRVGLKLSEITSALHERQKAVLLNGLSLDNVVFDMSQDTEEIKLRNLINVRFIEEDFKHGYLDGLNAAHLAPEVFNDAFTPKSDQYNIAALVYQMISGVLPYYNDEFSQELDTKEIANYLGQRNQSLKFSDRFEPYLKEVLSRALAFKSEDRFDSVDEFSKYLNRDKLLSGTSVKTKNGQSPRIKLGNGFSDIAGMEDLKNTLKMEVLDVLKRPDHYKKYGVTIPNGMLLYGPPGCGKSFISEKFCEEAGFNFFMVKPSDLSSIYVSGGEEKIGQLFKQAEENAPTVICFDEVDAVMPRRADDSNHSISARVNEFLAQINKCSDRGIFVIATTNKPNLIDDAMLRTGRLEIKVYVPPPDKNARMDLFKMYLKNRHCDENLNFDQLSDVTNNYVASDVEYVVNKSAHAAAIREVRISMEILKEIIGNFRPSINQDILKSYDHEHKKFSGSEPEPPGRSPIGFNRN